VKKEAWPDAERSIEAAFEDYAQYGVCLSMGDWNPDVHGVSTPMVSNDGSKVVAFSVSLPAHLAPRRHLIDVVAPKLVAMRDRVHRQLGGTF
jgi:DNA-binding IclR family transcriptional regulator